jgi:hypothetical protein
VVCEVLLGQAIDHEWRTRSSHPETNDLSYTSDANDVYVMS